MIDFRYHLVSLVSVFLALAVGIVLGAGPLKESIGTTLADRVESLRQEKDALRVDRDTAVAGIQHRDDFITAVTPSLVSGQLTGQSVAVVTLPGVDADVVDPLVDAITAAGGKVTGRVSLNSAWVDPQKAEGRTNVVTDLTSKLPTGTAGTTGTDDDTAVRLANLLAGALVSSGAGALSPFTDASKTVLDALRTGDLIEVKGNISGLAGGALVLAPAVPVDSTTATATADTDALVSYVELATALDTVGGGAVVTGPASSATDGGVLTAIRKDGTAKSKVSTVDSGSQPSGVITAVLALREQLDGGSGAYGFGSGASDLTPALAAVAPGVTSSSPTK